MSSRSLYPESQPAKVYRRNHLISCPPRRGRDSLFIATANSLALRLTPSIRSALVPGRRQGARGLWISRIRRNTTRCLAACSCVHAWVQLSRRTRFSTEPEEAQDSEHDDYGADEPDYVVHVKSPKWNESGCNHIMCRGSSGSNSPGKPPPATGSPAPIPLDLAVELDRVPTGQMTFLVTEYGNPFSNPRIGNKMLQWCHEAGLFRHSAHGPQKASASIAAEKGAASDQLKAIVDWAMSQQALFDADIWQIWDSLGFAGKLREYPENRGL
ncbi:hypothetical protein REMIM1_CH02972 [Rhizobium etli bv. mimosae str. Mim1]|nr:hypothetical protein REMIM1_CH02972 [Rhizobium etli bv. mimosae str. Mim1]